MNSIDIDVAKKHKVHQKVVSLWVPSMFPMNANSNPFNCILTY